MPDSLPNDPKGPAQALVEHLRRNPEEVWTDPAALAGRFGLEPEFVQRALASVPRPSRVETPRSPSLLAEKADGFVAWTFRGLDRAAKDPVRFEALTLFGAVAFLSSLSWVVPPAWRFPFLGVMAATMLGTVAAQMAVFARRRMTRFALPGGLVFGFGTALPMMVATWLNLLRHPETTPTQTTAGFVVFAVGLATLMLGVLYGGSIAFLSVLAGWLHLRQTEREWEGLSRQALLERYFELGRRLDGSVATPDEPEAWEEWPGVATVRRAPAAVAATVAILGSLAYEAASSFLQDRSPMVGDLVLVLLLAIGGLSTLVVLALVAFLSGRPGRGAMVGTAFAFGGYAIHCLSLVGKGALDSSQLGLLLLAIAAFGLIGGLAGVGARVQRRAARDRRRQGNDGATLVAEMLEIQRRLEEDATRVTVLVVDAAKSTAMKAGADPLDVEYSFREYQTWIAQTCRPFGGRVHSVAGDGAVVAFAEAASAMAAARRIQTDVARFNAMWNRLPKPFRLRLGLHSGQVAGDLDDVQFTEVIDIAAHVEEIAPVGGIAATMAVVSGLGEDGFVPLSRDVDGQAVSIALVPTEA